jgi:hypothetical protein
VCDNFKKFTADLKDQRDTNTKITQKSIENEKEDFEEVNNSHASIDFL